MSSNRNSANTAKGGALPKQSVYNNAEALQAQRFSTWKKNFKTMAIAAPDVGTPFSEEWKKHIGPASAGSVDTRTKLAGSAFRTYYPYTHVLPQEQTYEIQQQFTSYGGLARTWYNKNKIMGKAQLGPEFFEYAQKVEDRNLAQQFDAFVINNMDISSLLKKEYWKKKMPGYYDKLIKGMKNQLKNNFHASELLLEGPKTQDDWEFLYEHFVKPEIYNTISSANGTPQTPLPPDWDVYRNLYNNNPGPENPLIDQPTKYGQPPAQGQPSPNVNMTVEDEE